MRLKNPTASFPLNAQGIDAFSEWLDETLPTAGLEHKNSLRVRLLAEELLLRMEEHLQTQTTITATVDLRPGRGVLRLELPGAAFNPLNETDQMLGEWNSSLLTAVGLQSKFNYKKGKNILRLPLPQQRMNPVLKMLLLLLIGVLVGLLGLWLLPQELRETYCAATLEPAFGIWIRILNAASGPIIFFMALTTTLNTSAITRQGGSSAYTIARYLLITFLLVAVALVIAHPMLSVSTTAGTGPLMSWVETLTALIPGNIVMPFSDSNTPQLLLLAIPLAAAMIAAADHTKHLQHTVREINVVGSLIAKSLSVAIPYVAGLFLCLEVWSGRVKVLLGFWKPLALAFGISALLVGLMILWFSLRNRIGPAKTAKKLVAPFLLTLRGAPLDETMDATAKNCTARFGVDSGFAAISVPQGTVLYMPISAIGTLIFTMYLLNIYEINLSLSWQIVTVLLVGILFVATPPVPGANLLAFSALFAWIGIPQEAILDAMLFDILFGFFASAANLTLLQMETAAQAGRLGLLNTDVLRQTQEKKKAGKN